MGEIWQIVGGVAGLALLYYGAEWLVRGGVRLARAMGVPPLVIGLTLVAFATSAPELVVSIDSAWRGCGNVSLGNVVGSNICNIALILGAAAAIRPLRVHRSLFRRDFPLLILASWVLGGFHWLTGGVNRWEAGVLLAGLFAYVGWTLWKGKKDGVAEAGEAEEAMAAAEGLGIWAALGLVAAGIAGLAGGAKLLVDAAIVLARMCGVTDAVIALTVVALGTSLPELATSVVAAKRGESDIAVGNVVGSNLFNILSILGIAPLVAPITAPDIRTADMWTMLGLTVALPLFCWKGRLGRGWGWALLAGYAAYMGWLAVRG